jgi:hypothetical protein
LFSAAVTPDFPAPEKKNRFMQNILLDILIIGLLVILFGSIYRRQATVRVRFWLLGWFFILMHFGLLLYTPAETWGANLMVAAAEGGLLLCGAAFALSSTLVWEEGWRFTAPALLLSIPPVIYVTVSTLWTAPRLLLVGLGVVVQLSYGAVVYRFGKGRQGAGSARAIVARRWGAAILGAESAWLAILLLKGQTGNSIYPILSEIFLLNAVLYWEEFRRSTAGVLVGTFGLAAWGAVFPVALLMGAIFSQGERDRGDVECAEVFCGVRHDPHAAGGTEAAGGRAQPGVPGAVREQSAPDVDFRYGDAAVFGGERFGGGAVMGIRRRSSGG